MPIYGHYKSKPIPGSRIDWSHPLAQGLAAFYSLNEGAGPSLFDAAQAGPALALGSGATWGSGATIGLMCTATTAYAQATAPAALQISGPLTIAVGFRQLSSPTTNGELGGVSYNSSFGPPYYGYGFQFNSSATAVAFELNTVGTLRTIPGATVAPGGDYVLSASHAPGAQSLYQGGALVGTGANGGNPAYGSGPILSIGTAGVIGRNPALLVYWLGIWSASFPAAWHSALAANPWQLFLPPPYRIFGGMRRMRRTLYDRAGSRGVA